MKFLVISGTLTHDNKDFPEGSLVELKDEAVIEKLVAGGIIAATEYAAQTPSNKWKVEDIKGWLTEKQIEFEEGASKKDLLESVEKYLEAKKD